MKYISLNDLTESIRKNIYKIPHDIDFIIGIPRSGMIVGSIVSEFLNVPLIDINSFCEGSKPSGGNRLTLVNKPTTNKVLVIDDTCYSGASMKSAKDKLKDFEYEFIYMAAYLEGAGDKEIDIYLEDVRQYTKGSQIPIVLYQWNIFHHYPFIMQRCLYDIDGVLCCDPPDERKEEEYINYIKNAVPLFVPSVPIGGIVTYRLIKYQDITTKWLKDNGISYGGMCMFNAQSWDERNESGISPEQLKALVYKANKNMILFIESNDYQAQQIHKLSGKPVLCVESNKLYDN